MKPHVETAEGRWLPSRYRYALFRLLAFLILKTRASAGAATAGRRYVIIIDRDQNPLESFTLSLFFVTWIAACLAVAANVYTGITPIASAGLFAFLILVAPVVIQLVLYAVAGVRAALRRAGVPFAEVNYEAQTAAFFLLMLAAALLALGSGRTALALLGWIWFALLGLNGAAALVMRLVAGSVAAVEARLREAPSEF